MDDRPQQWHRATAVRAARTLGRRLYLAAVVLTAGFLLGVAVGSAARLPVVEVRLGTAAVAGGQESDAEHLPLPSELSEEFALLGNVQQALWRFGAGAGLDAAACGDEASKHWSSALRSRLRVVRQGPEHPAGARLRLQWAHPDPARAAAVLQALSAWYVNRNCTEPLHAKRRAHQQALTEALAARDTLAQAAGDLERLEQYVRQVETQANASRATNPDAGAIVSSDPRALAPAQVRAPVDPAIAAAAAEQAELQQARQELTHMLETRTHEHPEVRRLASRVAEMETRAAGRVDLQVMGDDDVHDEVPAIVRQRPAAGMVELSSLLVDLYVRREQVQNEQSRVGSLAAHARRLEEQVRQLEQRHLVVERSRSVSHFERLAGLREGVLGSGLSGTLLAALAISRRIRVHRIAQIQRALGLEVWGSLTSDQPSAQIVRPMRDRALAWTRLSCEGWLVALALTLSLYAWANADFRDQLDANPWQAFSFAVRSVACWMTA